MEAKRPCIMPECPYCPSCRYGLVICPEDTEPGEGGVYTRWVCLYDPAEDSKN